MAQQNKKLNFLTMKIIDKLNISQTSEENVTLVMQNLLLQNKEYMRIPKSDLRESVSRVIEGATQQSTQTNGAIVAVPSSIPQSPVEKLDNAAVSPQEAPDSEVSNAKAKKRKRGIGTAASLQTDSDSADNGMDMYRTQSISRTPRPDTRLADLAGIEAVIKQVREIVFFPIQLPELYRHLGISPPSGLLLHGPSGCGKTSLANAIAGELNLPYFKASGPELIGGTSGESEQRVRSLFEAAMAAAPSVLFIDGLDVIAGKREASQRGMDRRVVAQLFDCIDDVKSALRVTREEREGEGGAAVVEVGGSGGGKHVILLAASNRPDTLDPGVRGRFARELSLPVPDSTARTEILRLVTKHMTLAADVDFVAIGKSTPGYVGADLHALASEAGLVAVRRIVQEISCTLAEGAPDGASPTVSGLCEAHQAVLGSLVRPTPPLVQAEAVGSDSKDDNAMVEVEAAATMLSSVCPFCTISSTSIPSEIAIGSSAQVCLADFLQAAKSVQPSAKREGFAVVPDVTWKDVGALAEAREELLYNVLDPISHPERFLRVGLDVPAGVLFYGPPGCGKTLLAKALANQSGANFISVKGPELLNMYVGESESRVRQVFSRARASAPCVIFFDELDALCPKRGSGHEGGSGVSERVVNQLLTELDGLETRKDVYVIAATNRLELIDDAMLRPGRLGKLLYVPLPSAEDRGSILSAICRKVNVDTTCVDFEALGRDSRAEGFSGADLAALVREGGLAVMNEWRVDMEARRQKRLTEGEAAVDPAEEEEAEFSKISVRHFEVAFGKVRPSVSPDDRARFDLVHHFVRDEGLGAIEALRAAREVAEGLRRVPGKQSRPSNI